MTRKTRGDCTVGVFEKKQGLPPGTIRNEDVRDTRSDKTIGTIRKETGKKRKRSDIVNPVGQTGFFLLPIPL